MKRSIALLLYLLLVLNVSSYLYFLPAGDLINDESKFVLDIMGGVSSESSDYLTSDGFTTDSFEMRGDLVYHWLPNLALRGVFVHNYRYSYTTDDVGIGFTLHMPSFYYGFDVTTPVNDFGVDTSTRHFLGFKLLLADGKNLRIKMLVELQFLSQLNTAFCQIDLKYKAFGCELLVSRGGGTLGYDHSSIGVEPYVKIKNFTIGVRYAQRDYLSITERYVLLHLAYSL